MALTRRRSLRVLVLICTAAVLTGITAAVAADRIAIEPASATLGWCTHYSLPYGQWNASGWEAQYCYDHYTHYGPWHATTGVAIRDSSVISFNSGGHNWSMWYRNENDSYNCCWAGGLNNLGGSIGGSNGYAEAICDPADDPAGFSMYCTTWW